MITSALLEAYLACPTKCYLQSVGESESSNEYATWSNANKVAHQETGLRRLETTFADRLADGQVHPGLFDRGGWQLATNQVAEAEGLSAAIHAIQRMWNKGARSPELIPIQFVYGNKLKRTSRILSAFDALVISRPTCRPIQMAKIVHGDSFRIVKLQVAGMHQELTRTISQVRALLTSAGPPDLAINRHCPVCEFRDRCWTKAMQKDELSLLAGLSAKERASLNRNGIFTVTQLSYTFRPRRRPKRFVGKGEKYHHSLRALAIREKKIHIAGRLALHLRGTPIFFDVESIPDRDFYYLIGVRIEAGDHPIVRSFWASSFEDERAIWTDFLEFISTVHAPLLVHYGSFETKFLKVMCNRYGLPPTGSVAGEAVAAPLNLLSAIYGVVYFPTYTNGLKENARYLGFEWTEKNADGLQAIAWRHSWERVYDPTIREKLVKYNMEDCAALGVVALLLTQLSKEQEGAGDAQRSRVDVVQTESIRPATSRWRPFTSPISDLERISHAARWDYQSDRVFVRSATRRKWAKRQVIARGQPRKVQKIILLNSPVACPNCQKIWRKKGRLASRTVHDLLFGTNSLRRRTVKYTAQTYICRSCGHHWAPTEFDLHGPSVGMEPCILFYLSRYRVANSPAYIATQHE
jgi:predicted RecB family nuclease